MTEPQQGAIWLQEQDVVDLVSLNDAIDAFEQVVVLEGESRAVNVPKAMAVWGGAASLHALASAMTDAAPYCGTKTWINTPRGAVAIYVLFDGEAGTLLAMIEANALGALRTAAASGLATQWMADPDADDFAIIGTGRQALLQVAAVAVVRPIRRIRVFSPTREHQLRFASAIGARFDVRVEAPSRLADAVDGAPVVTAVTRAKAPFLGAALLAPGAHLNAVGAILPANAELLPDILERADAVVVDNLPNVKLASREFIDFYGAPSHSWDAVETLGSRIAAGRTRASTERLTVFKSVGMGLADLAVASRAFEAAKRHGRGTAIASPTPAVPRWKVHARTAGRSKQIAY